MRGGISPTFGQIRWDKNQRRKRKIERRKRSREREKKEEKGFPLLFKIYENRAVGFRQSKRYSRSMQRVMHEYQNLGVLSNSKR